MPDEEWVAPFRARWDNVEAVMGGFRALGLTASRDDVDAAAAKAYSVGASGGPDAQLLYGD